MGPFVGQEAGFSHERLVAHGAGRRSRILWLPSANGNCLVDNCRHLAGFLARIKRAAHRFWILADGHRQQLVYHHWIDRIRSQGLPHPLVA